MDRDDSEIEHHENDDKDSSVVERQEACKIPVVEYQEDTDNPAVEYEEDNVPAHFENEKRQSRELTEIGKQKHSEALEKVKLEYHSKAPQRPKHRIDDCTLCVRRFYGYLHREITEMNQDLLDEMFAKSLLDDISEVTSKQTHFLKTDAIIKSVLRKSKENRSACEIFLGILNKTSWNGIKDTLLEKLKESGKLDTERLTPSYRINKDDILRAKDMIMEDMLSPIDVANFMYERKDLDTVDHDEIIYKQTCPLQAKSLLEIVERKGYVDKFVLALDHTDKNLLLRIPKHKKEETIEDVHVSMEVGNDDTDTCRAEEDMEVEMCLEVKTSTSNNADIYKPFTDAFGRGEDINQLQSFCIADFHHTIENVQHGSIIITIHPILDGSFQHFQNSCGRREKLCSFVRLILSHPSVLHLLPEEEFKVHLKITMRPLQRSKQQPGDKEQRQENSKIRKDADVSQNNGTTRAKMMRAKKKDISSEETDPHDNESYHKEDNEDVSSSVTVKTLVKDQTQKSSEKEKIDQVEQITGEPEEKDGSQMAHRKHLELRVPDSILNDDETTFRCFFPYLVELCYPSWLKNTVQNCQGVFPIHLENIPDEIEGRQAIMVCLLQKVFRYCGSQLSLINRKIEGFLRHKLKDFVLYRCPYCNVKYFLDNYNELLSEIDGRMISLFQDILSSFDDRRKLNFPKGIGRKEKVQRLVQFALQQPITVVDLSNVLATYGKNYLVAQGTCKKPSRKCFSKTDQAEKAQSTYNQQKEEVSLPGNSYQMQRTFTCMYRRKDTQHHAGTRQSLKSPYDEKPVTFKIKDEGCEDNSHILPECFQVQSPSCASGLLEYSMTSNPRVTAKKFDGSKSINCQPMKEYPNEKRFDPADVMDSEEKEEPMETKSSNEVSDVLYGLDSIRLKEENRVQTDVHMLPPSTNHGNDQTCNRRGRCEDNSHILPEGFQVQPPSCASGLLEYSMTSNTRGIGVIINNCKFHDSINNNLPDLERKGAHHDTEALVPFLKSMRFDVRSFKDLSAVQIRMILTEIANLNHKQYDCLMCCICSHGRGNSLLGSDCSEISVEAVRSIFRIEKCPSLSGKPKIFFIQACNGQNLEGIQLAQTYQEDSFPDSIKPAKSDELIGYSTVDDHASFRHPLEGSVYIQTLVKYMKDLRQTTELCQILTKVNQKVGDQFMPLKDGLVGKQMPRYESTLMKLLYLKD